MIPKMKECIVICALVLISSARADVFYGIMAAVEERGNACIPTVNAVIDDLKAVLSHKIPTSHEGKCLIACIQKGLGMQSEDGRLDKEGAMKSISIMKDVNPEGYEILTSVFEKCLDQVPNDDDECVTGANFKQCILDNVN